MGLVAAWLCRNCDVWLGGGTAERKNFLDWVSFRGCMVFAINGVDVVSHSAWLPSCNPDFLRDAWLRQLHRIHTVD
jgi:hypothetical protein